MQVLEVVCGLRELKIIEEQAMPQEANKSIAKLEENKNKFLIEKAKAFYRINKTIKEIDDFENRSCANCKHWKTFNSGEYDFVMCHNTNSCSCEWETDKDFCCNRWQEK